jgi:hypothetical protein
VVWPEGFRALSTVWPAEFGFAFLSDRNDGIGAADMHQSTAPYCSAATVLYM